jgi:hypothetical protein
MNHALGKIVKAKYLDIIKKSNREVDDWTKPTGDEYKHYMYPRGDTPEDAKQAWQSWVDRMLEEAHKKAKEGKCEDALKLLGEALHGINDSESPVHADKDGEPMLWDIANQSIVKKHSRNDSAGVERSKDITAKIYSSQDKKIMDAFNKVFDADCPCKKKIDP